jgi:hypothetical protein
MDLGMAAMGNSTGTGLVKNYITMILVGSIEIQLLSVQIFF